MNILKEGQLVGNVCALRIEYNGRKILQISFN